MSPDSLPKCTAAWVLDRQIGPEGLDFVEQLPLPPVGEDQVLVKLHAASLNYRDLAMTRGIHNLELGKKDLVPGSDGAGVVEAVGSGVSAAFRVGDRVCTHLTCGMPEAEEPGPGDIRAGLGHTADGTLRRYGVFRETSLVKMPANTDFLEAATLTCSGLTAWNALFGLRDKAPGKGDTVLVQGTGGVSIAALQFALAAGATVIATTSSEDKARRLTALGAHHVLNYRATPDWGTRARALTADGKGCHVVVDVGGAPTLRQSLAAVRVGGMVAVAGLLGEGDGVDLPTVLDCLAAACTARGFFLGTKRQFADMNRFVEAHAIRPVVDERVFGMAEVREAFAFLQGQKHFSKVGIRLC